MPANGAAVDAELVRELEDGFSRSVAIDQAVKVGLTKLTGDAALLRCWQHAWVSIFSGQRLFEEALHRW